MSEADSGLEGSGVSSAASDGGDGDLARFFEIVLEGSKTSGEALGFIQISEEYACVRDRRMPALVLLRWTRPPFGWPAAFKTSSLENSTGPARGSFLCRCSLALDLASATLWNVSISCCITPNPVLLSLRSISALSFCALPC